MALKQYIKRALRFIKSGQPVVNVTATVVRMAPSELLSGRSVLITGGTSGIGKSIAESMLDAGATVTITGRDHIRLEKAENDLKSKYPSANIYAVILDNSDIESFEFKIKQIVDIAGKIDILVNNAGILGGEIGNVTETEYDSIMDVNLKGAFFLSKVLSRYMIDNGIKGNILNISSSSSLRPASSAYTLSKWGLRGLTLGLAKTLAPYGITVNGIAPGPTATPMLIKDGRESLKFNNPLGRYILPDEIANMAVILTSGIGRSVIGDTLYMTGGSGLITLDDVKYRF